MNKQESMKLKCGLYNIYWEEEIGGGSSVAAIGMMSNGDRWLAPTNWISPTFEPDVWEMISHVEMICTQKEALHDGYVSVTLECGCGNIPERPNLK